MEDLYTSSNVTTSDSLQKMTKTDGEQSGCKQSTRPS